MRRTSIPLVLGLLLVVATASPSGAYEDVGYDPDDREQAGDDPDIRATWRRVAGEPGNRRLVIVVQAYEPFGIWWGIDVMIDSHHDVGADFVMHLWNRDTGGSACRIHPQGRPNDNSRGRFEQTDDVVRCQAPARLFGPDERIRWRLVSETGYGADEDRAPNRGWYV